MTTKIMKITQTPEFINAVSQIVNKKQFVKRWKPDWKPKNKLLETKKKYVAAQQDWKCKHCGTQLTATFEVDHKIELQHGGSNHVTNLEALCRNCHGNKTMMTNLEK